MKLEEIADIYNKSGKDWSDFLTLFCYQTLEDENIDQLFKLLDRDKDTVYFIRYYRKSWGNTKKIIKLLNKLIIDYESGLSTVDLQDKYDIPRSSLQYILFSVIDSRSKSESGYYSIIKGYDRGYNAIGYGETEYASILKELGYKFDQQYPIYYKYDDKLFICDFYIKELNLIIEVDDSTHDTEDGYYRTQYRNFVYRELGYKLQIVKPEDHIYGKEFLSIVLYNYNKYRHWYYYNELRSEFSARYIRETKGILDYMVSYNVWEILPKEHPRYNSELTYDLIMKYIKSFPKYSITCNELYNDLISRNPLILRLQLEAPGKEKDLDYFLCKYLKFDDFPSTRLKKAALEVQKDGLRDFNLKTEDDLRSALLNIEGDCQIGHLINIVGRSRNYCLKYCYDILNIDPYDLIYETNEIKKKNFNTSEVTSASL